MTEKFKKYFFVLTIMFVFILTLCLCFTHALALEQTVFLVVGYCPTLFSSEMAVVQLSLPSGAAKLVGRAKIPEFLHPTGCMIEADPIVSYDPTTKLLYMMFGDLDFGTIVVNVQEGKVSSACVSSNEFFAGFETMQAMPTSTAGLVQLVGFDPTVTQHGLCKDACVGYATMGVQSSSQQCAAKKLRDWLPFKAVMDDTHIVYNGQMMAQMSYDLRNSSERCAPTQADLCLVAVDIASGELKSSKFTDFTVYKWAKETLQGQQSTVRAWIDDYKVCKVPYESFAFADVNLETAKFDPSTLKCIASNITVQMDEWIGSFSHDSSTFVTASGNAYAGVAQLLAFDANNARLILQSDLSDVKRLIGGKPDGMFDIWAVDFF